MGTSHQPSAPSPFRLICFDLDGVLYSSEPFLGEAYQKTIALVNEQRPGSFERVPSTREILDHVGWPVPVILQRLFPRVDPEAIELLRPVLLEVICEGVAARRGILYPDVPEVLRALQERFALAIASNGRSAYVESVLTTYGLSDLILPRAESALIGDKNAILESYLRQLGLGASRAIMVGDRASDVEAARSVGCPFIGCDYGHGYRDEIEGAGPIVTAFAQIPSAADSLVAPTA
jgi:phosphoglycolate phosphatase-like HAD superfamily hydrolase